KKDEKNFVIGLNISGLLYMGGYTKNNMFRLKTDYRELVYDTIGLLMKKPDVVVLLVPHVFGSPDHAESDSVVCEKIHGELKEQYKDRLFLAKGNYNQNEIKYIIGLCDFFIGSRMHACIAALSQGIPAVAIAYSKKFLGVMHTIGAESLIADPRTMNKKEIMTSIEYAYAQQHVYRKQLQSAMPRVKQRVLNLFDEITQ
ncbi:MAG: polysaccharide pyruvyl transferase family protein, partial [bacterium]